MKTTPVQQLPYPESTDPVADYPTVAKQMVELLDLVLPPVGAIIAYAGSAEPEGWFFCDGAVVAEVDYPKLAAVLGVAPGATFHLPDLRDRWVVGATSGQALTVATINKAANEANHTHGGIARGTDSTYGTDGGSFRPVTPFNIVQVQFIIRHGETS